MVEASKDQKSTRRSEVLLEARRLPPPQLDRHWPVSR